MAGGENWLFNNTGGDHVGDGGIITGTTSSNAYFAYVDASGFSTAPATLTSPFIDISTLTTPQLSFYEISDKETGSNSVLDVEVWDGLVWNSVATFDTNTTGWEKKEILLSALTFTGPAAVRFTFSEVNSFSSTDDIAIDDVTFENVPVCLSPTTLTAINITTIAADLGWTSTASAWDIEWSTAGFSPTGTPTIPGTTTNPHNLTGLTNNTSYDFYVRTDCGASGVSTWTGPFNFTTVASCASPTILTTTSITSTSADLGWIDNSGVALWDIESDIAGFTPTGTPTVTGTTTNPHNLTGLTTNTIYDFYVRANCGVSGTSTWTGPFNFTTQCTPFTVPFSENFNSTSTTQNCWTVLDNNSDGDMWNMDYGSNALAGNEVAMMATLGNNGANDDYLITPTLALTGGQQLRFSYKSQSSSLSNDLEVLLSTTGIGVSNFVDTLMPLEIFTNTIYTEKFIDLSAYIGNVNIAFHVPNGGSDGWRLYIDSVEIEPATYCFSPTNLTVTNSTNTSVNLAWTSTATTWDIELGIAGFNPTGTATTASTTTNPTNVAGLTDDTSYDFYVRADCGADSSTWAGPFNFSTITVGINKAANKLGLSIYPNPTNGIFTLNVKAKNVIIEIMNTTGQVIFTKTNVNTNEQINLSNNPKGIYFVTVISNETVTTQKVIVR